MKTNRETTRGYMVQIDELIKALTETREKFGNTCIYVRGSLSWGAVALNRQADDATTDKADAFKTFDGAPVDAAPPSDLCST